MAEVPVPSYLEKYLTVSAGDEYLCAGQIECTCGNSRNFRLLYAGETMDDNGSITLVPTGHSRNWYFIIYAVCAECGKQILLIDDYIHGWYVLMHPGPERIAYPQEEMKTWECLKCSSLNHSINLKIDYYDKDYFLEHAIKGQKEKDRGISFNWFTISLTCSSCNLETPEWVSYNAID